MGSSEHIYNKKYILILGTGPIDGLDDTALTPKNKYSINFARKQKTFSLHLHYNGLDNCIFFNGVEIYKCKANYFEVNAALLSLGDVSKDLDYMNIPIIFQLIKMALVLIMFQTS